MRATILFLLAVAGFAQSPAVTSGLRAKSLGFNVDDDNLGLWQTHARPDDLARIGPQGLTAGAALSRGYMVLQWPPDDSLVNRARAVAVGEATTPAGYEAAASQIHAMGKEFVVAPTGRRLRTWGDAVVGQIASGADVFVIQAERWLAEDRSAEKTTFIANVTHYSEVVRQVNPHARIFVEVGRRTAEEWINAFSFLYASAPQSFDGIYLPAADQDALTQMLAYLRPNRVAASIRAELHDALQDVILDGDLVYASAIRDRADVWNEAKFQRALDALAAIDDSRVRKSLVFSSVDDLRANLTRLPDDVTWVSYDSEQGITPTGEIQNLSVSVREFAQLAHSAGLRAGWGPTVALLASNEAEHLALAKDLDAFTFQHQKILENAGVDAFVSETERRAGVISAASPSTSIGVQVVIGRGTNDELVQALQAVLPQVAQISVFTTNDAAPEAQILQAVRGVAGAQ